MNFFDILFEASQLENMKKSALKFARDNTTLDSDKKSADEVWAERSAERGDLVKSLVNQWVKTKEDEKKRATAVGLSRNLMNVKMEAALDDIARVIGKEIPYKGVKKDKDDKKDEARYKTIQDVVSSMKEAKEKQIKEHPERKVQIENSFSGFSANDLAREMQNSPVFFMQVLYIMYDKIFKGRKLPIDYNGQLEKLFDGIKNNKSLKDEVLPEIQTSNAIKKNTKSLERQRKAVLQKIKDMISEKDETNSLKNDFIDSYGTDNLSKFSGEAAQLTKDLSIIQQQIKEVEANKENAEEGLKKATIRRTVKKEKPLAEDEFDAPIESKLDKASQNVVQDIRKKNGIKNRERHISQQEWLKLDTENKRIKIADFNLAELKRLEQNISNRLETINNIQKDTKTGKEKWREQRAVIGDIEKELQDPSVFKKRVAFMNDPELNKKIDEYTNLTKQIQPKMSDENTVSYGITVKGKKGKPDKTLWAKDVYIGDSGIDFAKTKVFSLEGFLNKLRKTFSENTGNNIYDYAAKVINYMFFGTTEVPKDISTKAMHTALSRDSAAKQKEYFAAEKEKRDKEHNELSQQFIDELKSINPKELKSKIEENNTKIQSLTDSIDMLTTKNKTLERRASTARKKGVISELEAAKLSDELNKLKEVENKTEEQKQRITELTEKLTKTSKNYSAISSTNQEADENKAKIKNYQDQIASLKKERDSLNNLLGILEKQSKTGDFYFIKEKMDNRRDALRRELEEISDFARIKEKVLKRRNKQK